jgi:hypothetical protein
MSNVYNDGPWHIEFRPSDGGRLSRISYKGDDLLTTEPVDFHPPITEMGNFERRAVYGYDDCFPSVGTCYFPESSIRIPDHGELCWIPWEVREGNHAVTFFVKSKLLPVAFERKMSFTDSSIVWDFEVHSQGNRPVPFQHVMHPLFKPEEIRRIELPDFESAYDWTNSKVFSSADAEKISEVLLSSPERSVEMFFLRKIRKGEVGLTFSNGIRLGMKFPVEYFPTIGIWWDNLGHPNEDGVRRRECSFEPTPGFSSVLSQAYADRNCMMVEPRGRLAWQVRWEISTD